MSLNQGCARLHFFGLTRLWLIWQSRWLNSDSTQIPNLITWLNSDSTQNPNLLTWLNSDSTHLSQSWVKSDSRLITFYLIWEKLLTGGGGVWSNVAVGWFFSLKLQIIAIFSRFLFEKSMTQLWLKQYPVDSTLTQMTFSVIRLWLDSFESESSQIWLTTHESSTTLLWIPKSSVRSRSAEWVFASWLQTHAETGSSGDHQDQQAKTQTTYLLLNLTNGLISAYWIHPNRELNRLPSRT